MKKIILLFSVLISLLIVTGCTNSAEEYEIFKQPKLSFKLTRDRLNEIDYAKRMEEVRTIPLLEYEEIKDIGGCEEILSMVKYKDDYQNVKYSLESLEQTRKEIEAMSEFTCKNKDIAKRHQDDLDKRLDLFNRYIESISSKLH